MNILNSLFFSCFIHVYNYATIDIISSISVLVFMIKLTKLVVLTKRLMIILFYYCFMVINRERLEEKG